MTILSDIFNKFLSPSHVTIVKTSKIITPQATAKPFATNTLITPLQTPNWRSSIVYLLNLLELDSSLQARKELAAKLGFKGDLNDSASMNIWLHRQVMNKLIANGGKYLQV